MSIFNRPWPRLFFLQPLQRHVVDFYISDFQSGLRALVKSGCGAKVAPYVDESVVIDINPDNKDMSPDFLRWLREKNLSSDDRIMRMKEGYSFFLLLEFTRKKLLLLPQRRFTNGISD
jgi:hypothetical protein